MSVWTRNGALLVTLLAMGTGCSRNAADLMGTWQSTDKGTLLRFEPNSRYAEENSFARFSGPYRIEKDEILVLTKISIDATGRDTYPEIKYQIAVGSASLTLTDIKTKEATQYTRVDPLTFKWRSTMTGPRAVEFERRLDTGTPRPKEPDQTDRPSLAPGP